MDTAAIRREFSRVDRGVVARAPTFAASVLADVAGRRGTLDSRIQPLSRSQRSLLVQQRLGHKRIEITLGIYAHVLPSMQQDAARRLGTLLHGTP